MTVGGAGSQQEEVDTSGRLKPRVVLLWLIRVREPEVLVGDSTAGARGTVERGHDLALAEADAAVRLVAGDRAEAFAVGHDVFVHQGDDEAAQVEVAFGDLAGEVSVGGLGAAPARAAEDERAPFGVRARDTVGDDGGGSASNVVRGLEDLRFDTHRSTPIS